MEGVKYFGISFPRTGTSSLEFAMKKLGFNTRHYLIREDYQLISRLDFVNDFPIPLRFRQLDEMFACSKFIFSDRPVEAWLKSYETHWRRTGHLTCSNWDTYNKEAFGTLTFNKDLFAERFLQHRKDVFEYFKDRPEDLLVLDMPYKKDAWEKLTNYVKVPDYQKQKVLLLGFPHACGSYASSNGWCPSSEVRIDDRLKYW
jgi:hypothetical protein